MIFVLVLLFGIFALLTLRGVEKHNTVLMFNGVLGMILSLVNSHLWCLS